MTPSTMITINGVTASAAAWTCLGIAVLIFVWVGLGFRSRK